MLRVLMLALVFLLPMGQANANTEKQCLAVNAYHEARGEPLVGIISVMFVVLNCVEHDRYPSTICGVIKQKSRNGCAFSWFCSKKQDINDKKSLQDMMLIADAVLSSNIIDPTDGAIYYHATYVDPYWNKADEIIETTKIGEHIFYTEEELVSADYTKPLY